MMRVVAVAMLTALMAETGSPAPYDFDASWRGDGIALGHGGPMLLQPDGRLIAAASGQLVRLDHDGVPDSSFGIAGRIAAPPGSHAPLSISPHIDGRFDVVWEGPVLSTPHRIECEQHWARYTASGSSNTSFGTDGVRVLRLFCSYAMQLDSAAQSYWLVLSRTTMTSTQCIVRGVPDGSALSSLECSTSGAGILPTWTYHFLRVDPRDRLLVGLRAGDANDRGFGLKRFASGVPDLTFGSDGVAVVPLAGSPVLDDAVALQDGSVLLVGTTRIGGRIQAVVTRLTERGSVDTSFGDAGIASVPLAFPDESDISGSRIAVLPDGRIVVAATVTTGLAAGRTFVRIGLARLTPTGAPDTRFAGAGLASAWTGGGNGVDALALRPTGEILLDAGVRSGVEASNLPSPAVMQLRGGDLPSAHPLRERRTVEYLHANYGHYFMTAAEAEMAILDTAASRAWTRTGKVFNVIAEGAAPLAPVCRFWSGQAFAPKSSHFYTPYADECAKVKQDPVWQFEGHAYALRLPEAGLGYVTCPADTRPLYRAYNRGMSGAPNHRYTTDPAVLGEMVAQGWQVEGDLWTRIFACVPAQE